MANQDQQNASLELVATPQIEQRIYVIRERQVMLDEDLADLYGVETKRLIQQAKRNLERFPEDFMFQLRKDEAACLRSQIATSNTGRGGRRYAPYVFTEQGVAMLSSVLRSKTAIAVNIEIVRAFVELRRVANSYAAIETRLEQIEQGLGEHDEQLEQIFGALRQLIAPPTPPKRPVGFRIREGDEESKPDSKPDRFCEAPPVGHHVPADESQGRGFEVTICDLKRGACLSEHNEQLRQIFRSATAVDCAAPAQSAPSGSGFAGATSSRAMSDSCPP